MLQKNMVLFVFCIWQKLQILPLVSLSFSKLLFKNLSNMAMFVVLFET